MKRVMHLICTDVFSGAENVACQIMKGFKDVKGYEMVYCSPEGKNKISLDDRNIKFLKLDKFDVKNVKNAIKSFNPDIVHAHDIRASIMAAICCDKKVKIISHIHCNHENMRKINLKTIFYNMVCFKFSDIIWVSQSAFDNYIFKNKVIGKSIVLYNVINADEIYEKIDNDKNEYDKYDLMYLGRLTYSKNPERLIEIIRDIKKIKKDVRIAIVGSGNLEEKVKNLVKEYELQDNVKLLGYLVNPYKVLKSSKILILTSRYEGTPMVALEAIAMGKPIVTTPTDGMVDVVVDGETGYISNDNSELEEKIVSLLNDDEKYNKMIENIKKRNGEVNDINKYIRNIQDIYLK